MTEFKVGDKVRVLSGGDGVVTYGPVNSTFDTYKLFVVKQDGDEERAFKVSDLAALPAFAVGDKATHRWLGIVEITYGPYMDTTDIVRYMIRLAGGSEQPMLPEMLTALPKPVLVPVGTRVRVDRAKWAEECHGRAGVVTSNTDDWRADDDDLHPYVVRLSNDNTVHVAELTPVDEPTDTFEHDGIVYDLSAEYKDRDGDVWRLVRRSDGQVWADFGEGADPQTCGRVFTGVVRNYSPLRKL